ncbi:zinc knuckle CX2CX4HX4C containing protein [Tanacetum coccineum]
MAGVDVDTLTMEQYLALSRENQAPGVVKPKIGGNVNFKIKSQFMRELREDTFSGNKDEDAHDHIDRVLSIVGLFNIPGVSKDAAFIQRNIRSSSSKDELAALVNKLDNLGRDMKKLKESVHAIQVGCQICEGPHLEKDCPLNEELKQVEEVRYGEFGRTTPFNGSNRGKFRVGPPGYYTKIDNRPSYGEKRQSLEELLAKHQEESARRSTEMEETSGLNKLHGVSFISGPESNTPEVLQHQLPPKELNPGSFTLPLAQSVKFNYFIAMADLDMSKKAPLGIVENVLVKIDKFLFPSDFVILDNTPSETTILGRPFLATIHAEIDSLRWKNIFGN